MGVKMTTHAPQAPLPQTGWLRRKRFELPCTVRVDHKFESLHAEVDFGQVVDIHPGDEVIVHGAPIFVPYGETHEEERRATVVRATWPERLWTRLTGDFEFMELCEFSFSEERRL
ncbi:hypothetical protein BXY53_1834 [Dichotomicrobium thermohalophilum]|uniref:Uncharacterized protein n=2 Tax=Dichotomicrobium thermohalophilum TaxID=933063 RepID=A0A397Q632_9HYPH|nr:hypothetical protein BXY53_1834 [Dichotomicrobium thermohalophilum]